jgi:hypothetical protein
LNDGDNDPSPDVVQFVNRERRLINAAEAIAVLGLTPKLEAELAECRADHLRNYTHDFIVDRSKWV